MTAPSLSIQTWLNHFVLNNGASSGTVHLMDEEGKLVLRAHVHIPSPVLSVISTIPKGKGMAGLAWERDEPVSTCNIKSDTSGDVRPGAKAVNVQAAVALPIHADGQVVGVVGIAYAEELELSQDQLTDLGRTAESCPRHN